MYLSKAEAADSFKYLQTVQPYILLTTDYREYYKDLGKLGAQFVINSDELYSTLQSQCYFNENLIAEAKRLAQNYNLAISYMHVVYLFTKAKRDFIVSIGKSRMRENLRIKPKVDSELVMSTSLLSLVSEEDITESLKKHAKQRLKPLTNDLIKMLT